MSSTGVLVDCGHFGITEAECVWRSCTWVPQEDKPYCTFNKESTHQCSLDNPSADLSVPLYTNADREFIYNRFIDNVNFNGTGAVVASQDPGTPGGSYIFHWARDAALVMHTVSRESSLEDSTRYFRNYLLFENELLKNAPAGYDVRSEPKFWIDSKEPFLGPWCRPQHDGPPLRLLAVAAQVETLLNAELKEEAQWELEQSVVGAMMNHVMENSGEGGCDLWEEVQSHRGFLWNKHATYRGSRKLSAVMRRLIKNATPVKAHSLMNRIGGRSDAIDALEEAAHRAKLAMQEHVRHGILSEEIYERPKDGAALLSFVEFLDFDDALENTDEKFNRFATPYRPIVEGNVVVKNQYFPFLSPLSPLVTATVRALIVDFCDLYPLNLYDNQRNVPGILIGRYRGDVFAGGNPWVLHTAALASYFYQAAMAVLGKGAAEGEWDWIRETQGEAYHHLKNILGAPLDLRSNATFAAQLAKAGDGVLQRLRAHTGLYLAEQIDNTNGEPKGAAGLTWSYSNVLTAIRLRDEARSMIFTPEEELSIRI